MSGSRWLLLWCVLCCVNAQRESLAHSRAEKEQEKEEREYGPQELSHRQAAKKPAASVDWDLSTFAGKQFVNYFEHVAFRAKRIYDFIAVQRVFFLHCCCCCCWIFVVEKC